MGLTELERLELLKAVHEAVADGEENWESVKATAHFILTEAEKHLIEPPKAVENV